MIAMLVQKEINNYFKVLEAFNNGDPRAVTMLRGKPKYDPIPWILYDRQRVAAAQSATLSFFKNPLGSTQDGATKTYFDTNLDTAGVLPAPRKFSVYGIQISYQSTSSPGDIKLLLNQAYGEFIIGAKQYSIGPLKQYPSGEGVVIYAGGLTDATIVSATSGHPSNNEMVSLARGSFPITIPQQQVFEGRVGFKAAVALSTTVDVWFKLNGILWREVQ